MRDDKHADAGSSHVGSPARCDSSRISAFVRSDIVERAADAEFARRLPPGPIVAAVVGVAPSTMAAMPRSAAMRVSAVYSSCLQ